MGRRDYPFKGYPDERQDPDESTCVPICIYIVLHIMRDRIDGIPELTQEQIAKIIETMDDGTPLGTNIEKINEQIITVADEDREILLKEVALPDLLKAFAKVWERAAAIQKSKSWEIFDDRYTVREKMEEIVERLKKGKNRFNFDDLFRGSFDKMEVITTFLAILELVRQNFIRLMQEGVYGNIQIIGYNDLPRDMQVVDEELNQQSST